MCKLVFFLNTGWVLREPELLLIKQQRRYKVHIRTQKKEKYRTVPKDCKDDPKTKYVITIGSNSLRRWGNVLTVAGDEPLGTAGTPARPYPKEEEAGIRTATTQRTQDFGLSVGQ